MNALTTHNLALILWDYTNANIYLITVDISSSTIFSQKVFTGISSAALGSFYS
jgi:hypothetical protein